MKESTAAYIALQINDQESKSSSSHHVSALDGLRGLAALCVFNLHFFNDFIPRDYHPSANNRFLWIFRDASQISVTLFFIVSGRVIVNSLLQPVLFQERMSALASSFIKRPLRICLPVIFSFIWHFILYSLRMYSHTPLSPSILPPSIKYPIYPHNVTLYSVAQNTMDVFYYQEKVPGAYQLWTLPIELYSSFNLYMIVFLGFMVGSRDKRLKWLFYALLFILFLSMNSWMFVFMTGLFIAEFKQSRLFKRLESRKGVYLALQCLLMIPILFYMVDPSDVILSDNFYTWLFWGNNDPHLTRHPRTLDAPFPFLSKTLICLCIVLLTEFNIIWRRIFSTRCMQLLGKASFGLYCLHLFTFRAFGHLIVPWVYTRMTTFPTVCVYVLILLLMVPQCILFYWIGDKGSIRISRILVDKLIE